MKNIIPYASLVILFLAFISPAYSFEYVHQMDKEEKVNAIYVSKFSQHSFPQKGYTYSFPVCDQDDVDILETLKVVPYIIDTIGTYSISIDYTDSDDRYVHRQTGYLVTDDSGSTNNSMPSGKQVWSKEGRILFCSKSAYSPDYLNGKYFKGNDSNSDIGKVPFAQPSKPYHMENALLISLYKNEQFFKRIKHKVPSDKTILGICIKIYSSYDFCGECRKNILTLVPYFQNRFAKALDVPGDSLPLTVLGLAYRPYNLGYRDAKGVKLGKREYPIDLYPQDKFPTFNGKINAGPKQSILPIYLYAQPDTPQDEKQALTLGKDEK